LFSTLGLLMVGRAILICLPSSGILGDLSLSFSQNRYRHRGLARRVNGGVAHRWAQTGLTASFSGDSPNSVAGDGTQIASVVPSLLMQR